MDLPEIVAGSYEELLLGYKIVEENEGYCLEQSFTDHSHTGCIKTVDISRSGILASGSTDETVRLFNLRKRVELGSLMEHEGAVSCVRFYSRSHLFTASEDQTICIWKSFTWERLRTLKGHRGAVTCLSVHPSGKMALSVGQDKAMHTWNLIKGRSAYITNTKQAADLVIWSLSGDRYVLVINNTIDVYNTETATVHCSMKSTGRINALVFIDDTVIAYGGEGGDIYIHDIAEDKQLAHVQTNTVRIRGLAGTQCPSSTEKTWLVSASSDGYIKVWEVTLAQEEIRAALVTMVTEHNTKFRLTCLAVTQPKGGNSKVTTKSAGVSVEEQQTSIEGATKIEERLQPGEGDTRLGSEVNSSDNSETDESQMAKSQKSTTNEQSKKTKQKRKHVVTEEPQEKQDSKKMKKRKKLKSL